MSTESVDKLLIQAERSSLLFKVALTAFFLVICSIILAALENALLTNLEGLAVILFFASFLVLIWFKVRFDLLLLSIAILVPIRFPVSIEIARSVSIADAVILLLGVIAILQILARHRLASLNREVFWRWALAYAILSLLSSFWSPTVSGAIRQCLILYIGMLTYVIITTYITSIEKLTSVLNLFIGLMVIAAGVAWFYWVFRPLWLENLILDPRANADIARSWELRLGSPLWGASNYFASLLLFAIPAALAGMIISRAGSRQFIWLFIAGGLAVSYLATLSAGAILTAVPMIGVLMLSLSRTRERSTMMTRVGVLMTVIGILIPLLLWWFDQSTGGRSSEFFGLKVSTLSEDKSVLSRLNPIFLVALPGIQSSPFFGHGTGSTLYDLQRVYLIVSDDISANFHSAFIQTAYELGLVGLVALLALFGYLFRCSWDIAIWATKETSAPISVRGYALGAPATIIGTVLMMQGQANWEANLFQIMFWFCAALITSIHRYQLEAAYLKPDAYY